MAPATSKWAYAYGHYDATIAILAPSVAEVTAQLRPGLTLARQNLTPAGTHPLVIMFGQHSDVRPWYKPPAEGGGYDEWIVATPFIEWTDGTGQVSQWATMSRLYLDSLWFTMLGWLYAYPKKLARMSVPPNAYQVTTFPGSRPRVDMQWQPAGPAVPWTRFPGATKLAPVFGQPFIERFPPLPWLGSRMWFELETSTIQPVTLHAAIEAGCAPGLAAMTFDARSISDGVPGAFRLSCDWLLSRPYVASHLPDALRGLMPPDC